MASALEVKVLVEQNGSNESDDDSSDEFHSGTNSGAEEKVEKESLSGETDKDVLFQAQEFRRKSSSASSSDEEFDIPEAVVKGAEASMATDDKDAKVGKIKLRETSVRTQPPADLSMQTRCKEEITMEQKNGLVFRHVSVVIGEKNIISNISGFAEQGKLLAIMGPSGAGKTTLLNALSGRLATSEGEITLAGTRISKKLKRKICYVLQDDIFFPSLTLRETLEFAAHVRLPDTMSIGQKLEKLDAIIDDLDIRNSLNTPMGGAMMPGLSGGERKRANIACELLTDPTLILLDEPTTGLDSSSALSVVQCMKRYASEHQKVVVATVHQPSTQLFYQFDHLLLMCHAQEAFFGKTCDVVDYFESIGYPVLPGFNPADFILDQMKNSEEAQEHIVNACKKVQKTDRWPYVLKRSARTDWLDGPESPSMLAPFPKDKKKFKGKLPSVKFQKTKSRPLRAAKPESDATDTEDVLVEWEKEAEDGVATETTGKFNTSYWTQFKYLTERTFTLSRPRIFDRLKIAENLIICAFFSLMWFQLPRSEDTIRDRMGAIFFISTHWAFIPLFDAVSSFPMEQVVICKERAGGWYHLSAYYLAKMISELPLIFVQPLVFVMISYWCIGLNGVTAFFATLGTVFVDSLAGQSLGLFLGITIRDLRSAVTIGIVIEMGIMLLGGLFTRHLPFWLDWMKYLSILHYAFHSLMYLEFHDGPPILCSRNRSVFADCRDQNITHIPSSAALEHYNVTWPFGFYLLPLFGFIVLFRVAGFLVLKYANKPR